MSWQYDPFGQAIPNVQGSQDNGGSELGYTGASVGTGSGYVYLRNRYYDPSTGRFLTEDPLGFVGGVNFYAYAENNPINFADPFGLCSWDKPQDCKIFSVSLSLSRTGVEHRVQAGPLRARVSATAGATGTLSLTGGGFKRSADIGVRVEATAGAGPASVRCGLTSNAGCSGSLKATDGVGTASIGTGTTPLAVGAQTTVGYVTAGVEVDLGGFAIVAARAVYDYVKLKFSGTVKPKDREDEPPAEGPFRP